MAENKAYLDTSAVSALVNYDIEVAGEMSALEQLLAWHESGKVILVCSPVVEDELAEIPAQYIELTAVSLPNLPAFRRRTSGDSRSWVHLACQWATRVIA